MDRTRAVAASALVLSLLVWTTLLRSASPAGRIDAPAQTRYSLKSIPVPVPPDLDRYVRDTTTLLALGKALFWDMQLSSDSRVACASCHFHAGADHRVQNQLSSTKGHVRPNQRLGPGDVPLRLDAMNAGWRVGSAGILPRQLSGLGRAGLPDAGIDLGTSEHQTIHGLNVRQVTLRNAPSVVNSVYHFRHFWDGRASDVFTGRTP